MTTAAPSEAIDRIFLERAIELAERSIGNTSPNPPVGAVVVAGGHIVGEGRHHRRGEAHAEVEALRGAGEKARGGTLYVSLEPCNHEGLTPPCTRAVIEAGIARVIVGTADPNPRTAGAGIAQLREAGIETMVAGARAARALIEPFAIAIKRSAPFLTLKLAISLDGYVSPAPGPYWLTGDEARDEVRELRAEHDAVMVGAGTVVADDPQLTVRPAHTRFVPYRRVIVADHPPLDRERRVFAAVPGYEPTLVLAAGPREGYRQLNGVAEIAEIPSAGGRLDLQQGLTALAQRGIRSVLCEGGPRLAERLLENGHVDRLTWLVAPQRLASESAVPALGSRPAAFPPPGWKIDLSIQLGADVLFSAHPEATA